MTVNIDPAYIAQITQLKQKQLEMEIALRNQQMKEMEMLMRDLSADEFVLWLHGYLEAKPEIGDDTLREKLVQQVARQVKRKMYDAPRQYDYVKSAPSPFTLQGTSVTYPLVGDLNWSTSFTTTGKTEV